MSTKIEIQKHKFKVGDKVNLTGFAKPRYGYIVASSVEDDYVRYGVMAEPRGELVFISEHNLELAKPIEPADETLLNWIESKKHA